MTKNIGFLARNVPVAAKKAEEHLNKATEISKEIGAKWFLGLAYLQLGLFHKARKRNNPARESLSEAVRIFEECDVNAYLKQAEEALASLA